MRRCVVVLVFAAGCGGADIGDPSLATVSLSSSARSSSSSPVAHRVSQQLVAAYGRTCQLRFDGSVRCWGRDLSDWSVGPTTVTGVQATRIGFHETSPVLRDREGRTWVLPEETRPDRIAAFTERTDLGPVDQSCSFDACCWVDEGNVACTKTASARKREEEGSADPAIVHVAGVSNVERVASGKDHICALTREGEVWCWGSNNDGQLGVSTERGKDAPPTRVEKLGRAVDIRADYNTTCARTAEGEIFCWGSGTFGMLGSARDSNTPLRIDGLPPAIDFAMSSSHACIVGKDGSVHCWGEGGSGQLGDGRQQTSKVPVRVDGIDDAVLVVAESGYTCAARRDESVACWGERTSGQLGDGSPSEEHTPIPVEGITGATRICAQGKLYPERTCVIDANQALRCWGKQSKLAVAATDVVDCDAECFVTRDGRVDCGDGPVAGVTDVGSASAWSSKGCGLRADGSVVCWTGEEGKKPNIAMKQATAIKTGSDAACALKGAGELWCWGEVARYASSKTPVRATGFDDVSEISLDDEIGLGGGLLRNKSGAVHWWYWAMTNLDKDKLDLKTKPLAGVTSAVALAGGPEDGCAVLADGHVKCWGASFHGELGNGVASRKMTRTPVTVANLEDAIAVTIGNGFRCALRRGGTVSCWGLNEDGQLGKPFTKRQPTPVAVVTAKK
ncbi:MAG: hypothetical protein HOW73_29735 [Polyangiaceae bacterium]|nr:hypothetical protein [Polyangiaceae bacterium]